MLLRKGGVLIKEGRRLVGNVKNSFYQVPGTGGGKEYNGEQNKLGPYSSEACG